MGDRGTMIAPNRDRHGFVKFTGEPLGGACAQSYCEELIVFAFRRRRAVAEVVDICQQILAVPEHKRLAFGAIDCLHLADINRMITTGQTREDPALKPRAATTQQRHAAETDIDIEAAKLISRRVREPIRQFYLILSENVHGEASGFEENRMAVHLDGLTPKNQRRVERYRTERVGGHAVKSSVLVDRGDHGDSRHERSQRASQLVAIEQTNVRHLNLRALTRFIRSRQHRFRFSHPWRYVLGETNDRGRRVRVGHVSEHEAPDHVVQPSARELIGQRLRNRFCGARNRMAGFDELIEGRRQLRVYRLSSMFSPELDEALIKAWPGVSANFMGLAVGRSNDNVAIDSNERLGPALKACRRPFLAISI